MNPTDRYDDGRESIGIAIACGGLDTDVGNLASESRKALAAVFRHGLANEICPNVR